MEDEKDIAWTGSSYDDLLRFPDDARREAGFQLGRVQAGLDQCSQLKPLDMHDAHAVCCDGAWDNCGWVVPGIEWRQ